MATNSMPGATTPSYNPVIQDLEEPILVNTTSNLEAAPKASDYIDPKTATVEGRVTNLLSAPNELLKAAQAGSDVAYNRRGLLNSGGAVQAGTGAMIDKAIQIATPDAALYGSLAQTGYKAKTDSQLNNQLADIERQKSLNNARLTAALTKQDLYGKEELQRMVDTAMMQRLEVDNQWKDAMNVDSLNADARKTLAASMASMGSELQGSIERVLRDTNITNKTAAIDTLYTKYKSNAQTTAAVLGINLTWS